MTVVVTLQRKCPEAHHMRDVFSNFGMRLFRYAKNRQDQGGPMSIVTTALALSMLLLTVTGCATSSPPPAAKQETGKKTFRAFQARVLGSSLSQLTIHNQ